MRPRGRGDRPGRPDRSGRGTGPAGRGGASRDRADRPGRGARGTGPVGRRMRGFPEGSQEPGLIPTGARKPDFTLLGAFPFASSPDRARVI